VLPPPKNQLHGSGFPRLAEQVRGAPKGAVEFARAVFLVRTGETPVPLFVNGKWAAADYCRVSAVIAACE
jgi:hypothetical protein